MGRQNNTKFQSVYLTGRGNLENLGIDSSIILQCTSECVNIEGRTGSESVPNVDVEPSSKLRTLRYKPVF